MNFQAPGRVNLIGEHTDYNLGFVLPIALDLVTTVDGEYSAQSPSLNLKSDSTNVELTLPVLEIAARQPEHNWTDYVIGVAQQLLKLNYPVRPANLKFHSTVPEGAGLSSSAAIEVCAALEFLQGRTVEPLEIAKLCQRAEREFVGVPSGIMDQYISVFGRKDHAVLIDCRSLTHQYVPIPKNVEIWAVNSMVRHALGNSAYKHRVEECATAADSLGVASLRDATLHQLETTPMPSLIHRRARHIITENERVQLFVRAAQVGDLERMGQLFYESHVSMQHDYEITCAEIDFLVQIAMGHHGCYGSRMTGGGFGGCTVNLLRPDAVEHFQQVVTDAYRERFNLTPQFIRCNPSDGAVASQDGTLPSVASSDDPHRD